MEYFLIRKKTENNQINDKLLDNKILVSIDVSFMFNFQ